MRLGKLLAIARVNRDLTPAELADAIGIKTRTLAAIERGGTCDGATLILIMAWLTADEDGERVVVAQVRPEAVEPVPLLAPVSRGVVE